jgi:DNA polymerase II small subunit/DNA polymerase delta subunit B
MDLKLTCRSELLMNGAAEIKVLMSPGTSDPQAARFPDPSVSLHKRAAHKR